MLTVIPSSSCFENLTAYSTEKELEGIRGVTAKFDVSTWLKYSIQLFGQTV